MNIMFGDDSPEIIIIQNPATTEIPLDITAKHVERES